MKLHGTMRVNDKNHLEIGGCDVVQLVKEFGTPLYVVDEALFRRNCQSYYRAFTEVYDAKVVYASKTLTNLAICTIINQERLGLDVVSGGELFTAFQAGFPMECVYFHGNSKSAQELRMAMEYNVGRIIVDNFHELELLNGIAGQMGLSAQILLRLSPGVNAHTHEHIKTGQVDSKFGFVIENGMALKAVKRVLQLPRLKLKGYHCHIGSQILELDSYANAAEIMMSFVNQSKNETDYLAEELNLGGGLGIYYSQGDRPPSITEYADTIYKTLLRKASEFQLPIPQIIVEPGRSIAGPSGTTLYTVGSIKDIPGIRKYISVDGGMGDNLRPVLYNARYEACLANRITEEATEKVSIAGKYCESGDMLISDIVLPEAKIGDILAVPSTGAYNYAMSMNYNRMPKPAMVLVHNSNANLIVRREDYEDLIRNDRIPERLRSLS